jgi:Cof subfamily protein (haloacid dehalogenase superfamily)
MIRLLLSDVDGTLVRSDKSLSERSIDAVHALHEAGIHFAVTSGRPPRGMEMLIGPLALATPLAAFNGGLIVEPGLKVLDEHTIPDEAVGSVLELLASFDLAIWVYRGADWLVRDPDGPHVAHEAHTVQFEPTVVDDFDASTHVAKIVGVGDDHDLVAKAAQATRAALGDHVSAWRSQPYYLDVTHPEANKGSVARFLAARYDLAVEEIATIGDMPNDVLMFAHSGLSIAMGNASDDVQKAARRVTTSNDEDGFAHAVNRYVLNERS